MRVNVVVQGRVIEMVASIGRVGSKGLVFTSSHNNRTI